MNREELVNLLADLVGRKAVTSDEASNLLDRFDAGDLAPEDLPAAAPPKEDSAGWLTGFALLLLMIGGNATKQLPALTRSRTAELLRGLYTQQVSLLSISISSGAIPLQTWQTGMQNALAQYTRQMLITGAGTMPDAAMIDVVEAALAEQWPFLERFGVEIVTRQEAGRAMSEALVFSRSRQYGGVAWAAYWRGEEDAQTDGQEGYIVYYESMDDPQVCRFCMEAQRRGPYLPGSGYPLPGQTCIAGGACRCRLLFEYDPVIFERMTQPQRRQAA